ncbi:tetratricopeptide repeat protein [Prochlorococcus sp. MIT 1323]|uniref:tetratricopeptide repeat protein n=1 Tax=Prochlorococcus sp. MIT 1323 TaxID=3082526 RepID=UPI0039B43D02
MTDLAAIKELSATGRHQECLQACQNTLQGNPQEAFAYKYAGKSLLALGQLEKAHQCLAKAHQLDQTDPEIAKDIGNIFNATKNQDEAEQYYKIALSIDPNYAPALNNLGLIAKQKGDLQGAVTLLKTAVEIDPTFAPFQMNLGLIYKDLGNLDQALTSTLTSLELKPDNPDAHLNLGGIYKDLRNLEQALTSTLTSLELKPDNPDAHLNLGGIYRDLGNLDQALTSTLTSLELKPDNPDAHLNLGGIYKDLRNLEQALTSTLTSLELKPDNPDAHLNLGGIYRDLGNLDQALTSTLTSLELKPDNPDAHLNLGGIYRDLGNLDQALTSTLTSLELKPDNPDAHLNLGGIYKDLRNLEQALTSTLTSLELKPDNPDAHLNLGGIYKDLRNLEQALTSTLTSLELKPDNPDARLNLSDIYKDLGNLDQALTSTLTSLELKPNNPGAFHNLHRLIDQLRLSPSNAHNLTKAYELLLNLDNLSHQKLSRLFIQIFLPTIQAAAKIDPIISANNAALNNLSVDLRLRKSLALLIPPHQDAENFLTRLRKELLTLASQNQPIPDNLKPLSEALATQCFLNEYVYVQSPEEDDLVEKLIVQALQSQELFNQYLAIIACYIPIHKLNLNQDWLKHYPTTSKESRTLIQIQLEEPKEEEKIKASIQSNSDIDDVVSLKVQDMYEENPYPRYRHADYTDKSLAKTISEIINIESTKHNLQFSKELNNKNARPKVLIAGCGTGGQVILASRYKNAQIKAIDLSSRSLAYAIRKASDYSMKNISFEKLDLLDVANLQQSFDIIECSGVLHHMEDPGKGLSALSEQLKPGGYFELGLYSEIARQQIVEARNQIKQLDIKSTPKGIRDFRQKVLNGDLEELSRLPQFGLDFYSLSTCRDLCFHVQEHRFTTELLQELLNSQGLIFCGFMLPEPIRKTYQKQFPNDTDMISLENWGEFEKQHPSTFTDMYQFWAYKPS